MKTIGVVLKQHLCYSQVMDKFKLREGKDVQTYGIGMKEVEPPHTPLGVYIYICILIYM